MKDLKILKRQSIYLVIMSFLVLGVLTSYALGAFEAVLSGDKVSSVSTCSLDINFVDTNPVTLLSGVPMDDVDANGYDPYVVTVSNNNSNCRNVNYVLTMNSLCANCEKTDGKCAAGDSTCNCNEGYQIDSSLIKYSVKNVETGVTTTGVDPYTNLKLRGTIASVGDTATYEIKMWISKDATNSDIYVSNGSGGYLEDSNGNYVTKDFCSKIKLDVDTQEKTLATAIMEQGVVTSGDGLYVSTATNDGRPTYYYRGAVENNYVDFAGLTWRVVRVNEDGSIRLITYDAAIGQMFAPNPYVFESVYYSATNVEGGIKKALNNWFDNTLMANYDSYIATSTYCEAAKVKSSEEYTVGNAQMVLYTDYTPDFKCPEDDGNGYGLIKDQKVGLLTLDELLFSGGEFYNATSSFLTKYQTYTMSPACTNVEDGCAKIWGIYGYDYIEDYRFTDLNEYISYPVINLNADITVTGNGSSGTPWVVQ